MANLSGVVLASGKTNDSGRVGFKAEPGARLTIKAVSPLLDTGQAQSMVTATPGELSTTLRSQMSAEITPT